jgi:hypothetical protein
MQNRGPADDLFRRGHSGAVVASGANFAVDAAFFPLTLSAGMDNLCRYMPKAEGLRMRCRFTGLSLSLLLILAAPAGWSQQLINVYVDGASADGFTNTGGGDSAQDLIKSLQGKDKTLRVVESSANADVIVRISSRDSRKDINSVSTYKNKSDDGKQTTTTTQANESTTRIVYATLTAGDFKTDIVGEGMTWRLAAGAVANKVDKWSKENYARLIEKRQQSSAPSTTTPQLQAQAAPAPDSAPEKSTSETTIVPGMTPAEVTKAMGEPQKKVTVGQKSLWTYKGMQVVFENDKVTDVKF